MKRWQGGEKKERKKEKEKEAVFPSIVHRYDYTSGNSDACALEGARDVVQVECASPCRQSDFLHSLHAITHFHLELLPQCLPTCAQIVLGS